MKHLLLSLCLLSGLSVGWVRLVPAQAVADSASLADVELFLETGAFNWEKDQVIWHGRPHLAFSFEQLPVVAELRLYPAYPEAVADLYLPPSADFVVLDSMILLGDGAYRTRLRFTALAQTEVPALTVTLALHRGDTVSTLVYLYPYTRTQANLDPEPYVLYLGEEKVLPIQCLSPTNIRPQPVWDKNETVAYRITLVNGQPQLHLIPLAFGDHQLRIPYATYRPSRDSAGKFVYTHEIEAFEISVKQGRVPLLSLGLEEIYLTAGARYAAREVRFDQQVALSVRQTYRIEDRERPGGKFVGELFVQEIQGNGKMKALLRAYDFHPRGEGPLYIKAQDQALFITNFAVIPAPHIEEIYIRRGEGAWTRDLIIQPGDSFDLRVVGQSLDRLSLGLAGLTPADTQRRAAQFLAQGYFLPYTHRPVEIALTANDEPTGHELAVKEYAKARPLDFIKLRLQSDTLDWASMRSPRHIYGKPQPFVLTFDRDAIDQAGDLYGPQYLEISASAWDVEGRRLEAGVPKQVVIMPGEASPRHGRYSVATPWEGDLKLQDLLKTPLDELPSWTQIRITVAHQARHHPEGGQRRQVEIVLARKVHLAMEFSFPVAIVMNRSGSNGSEVLNSLHFGAFLQLGLYQAGRVGQASPLRLHIGAMTTDVLSFRGEGQRDLGIATFFSVLPLDSSRRWNIPIYLGGGYLFESESAFFFMGPGISIIF